MSREDRSGGLVAAGRPRTWVEARDAFLEIDTVSPVADAFCTPINLGGSDYWSDSLSRGQDLKDVDQEETPKLYGDLAIYGRQAMIWRDFWRNDLPHGAWRISAKRA